MQNKKDLNDILSSMDPRLRDRLMAVSKLSEDKGTAAENAEETSARTPVEVTEVTVTSEEFNEAPADAINELSEVTEDMGEEAAPDGELPVQEEEISDSLRNAKEQAAEILSYGTGPAAKKKRNKKSAYESAATEIVILEFISLGLFFLSLKDGIPTGFSLFAVFLPALAGIGSRLFLKQLSLKEAVLKCKWHIILTIAIFICIVLSI